MVFMEAAVVLWVDQAGQLRDSSPAMLQGTRLLRM